MINTGGSRIKEARTQAKLTQKQLSERYKIPARSLEDWETCKRTPPEYVINLLLRCIEVDFGIKLEDTSGSTEKTFTLTYADGTPLNMHDEMHVRVEQKAKRVVPMRVGGQIGDTYQCSNGFIFRAIRN